MKPQARTTSESVLWLSYIITFVLVAAGEIAFIMLGWGMHQTAFEPNPQTSQWAGLMFVLAMIFATPVAVVGAIHFVIAEKLRVKLASAKRNEKTLIVTTSVCLGIGLSIFGVLVILSSFVS